MVLQWWLFSVFNNKFQHYSTHLNYQCGHTSLQRHYYDHNIPVWKILINRYAEMFQYHHSPFHQTLWLQFQTQMSPCCCMSWTQNFLWCEINAYPLRNIHMKAMFMQTTTQPTQELVEHSYELWILWKHANDKNSLVCKYISVMKIFKLMNWSL